MSDPVLESECKKFYEYCATGNLLGARNALRSMNGHSEKIRTLVEYRFMWLDRCKFTPLLIAVHERHAEIVYLLLTVGRADVNTTNDWGVNALFLAASKGSLSIVKMLVEVGNADVSAQNWCEGSTPLHVAARNSHLHVVEYLVNCKADFSREDLHRNSPLKVAQRHNHRHIVDYFERLSSHSESTQISTTCSLTDTLPPLYEEGESVSSWTRDASSHESLSDEHALVAQSEPLSTPMISSQQHQQRQEDLITQLRARVLSLETRLREKEAQCAQYEQLLSAQRERECAVNASLFSLQSSMDCLFQELHDFHIE